MTAANEQRCQCPICRRVRELNEELGIVFVVGPHEPQKGGDDE